MIYCTASLPLACVVTLFSNNATLWSGHISQIVGIIIGGLTVGLLCNGCRAAVREDLLSRSGSRSGH